MYHDIQSMYHDPKKIKARRLGFASEFEAFVNLKSGSHLWISPVSGYGDVQLMKESNVFGNHIMRDEENSFWFYNKTDTW